MPQSEFSALMTGQIAIHSVWESALMSCEVMHMLDENCKTIAQLEKRNDEIIDGIRQMDNEMTDFTVGQRTALSYNSTQFVCDLIAIIDFIVCSIFRKIYHKT